MNASDLLVFGEGLLNLAGAFVEVGELHGVAEVVGGEEVGLAVVLEGGLKLVGAFEGETEMVVGGGEVGVEADGFLEGGDADLDGFGIPGEDGSAVEVGDGDFGVEGDGAFVLGEGVGDFLLAFEGEGEVEVDEGGVLVFGEGFAVVGDGGVEVFLIGVAVADLGEDFGVGLGAIEGEFVLFGKGEAGLGEVGIDESGDEFTDGVGAGVTEPFSGVGEGGVKVGVGVRVFCGGGGNEVVDGGGAAVEGDDVSLRV